MFKYHNIKIIEAKNFMQRLIGLSFKNKIKYGMLFKNCRSIHTFFMLDNIDVIATDKDNKIIKEYKNVKPGKIIIAPKNVKNIYEMPKGTIK